MSNCSTDCGPCGCNFNHILIKCCRSAYIVPPFKQQRKQCTFFIPYHFEWSLVVRLWSIERTRRVHASSIYKIVRNNKYAIARNVNMASASRYKWTRAQVNVFQWTHSQCLAFSKWWNLYRFTNQWTNVCTRQQIKSKSNVIPKMKCDVGTKTRNEQKKTHVHSVRLRTVRKESVVERYICANIVYGRVLCGAQFISHGKLNTKNYWNASGAQNKKRKEIYWKLQSQQQRVRMFDLLKPQPEKDKNWSKRHAKVFRLYFERSDG